MGINKLFGIVLLLALTGLPGNSYGQDSLSSNHNLYQKGQLILGPYLGTVAFQHFSSKLVLGLEAELMASDRFGFGAVLGGGPDYAEFSSSILGLLTMASLEESNNNLALVVLSLLAFTDPCFHLKPSQNHDVVISADLLRFRYNYDKISYYTDYLVPSGSISMRYSTLNSSKRWQWSIYVDGSMLYAKGNPLGVSAGIALRHVGKAKQD